MDEDVMFEHLDVLTDKEKIVINKLYKEPSLHVYSELAEELGVSKLAVTTLAQRAARKLFFSIFPLPHVDAEFFDE